MVNKHTNKKKAVDQRLAYLHKLGLTDKTAEDLQAPDLSDFSTRAADDFEVIGADIPAGFEFYRATDELSIRKAEERGYFKLPSGADVRFKGCHTEGEIMMARTVEAGDAYRKAESTRREAQRTGTTSGSTPVGGGAVFNETTDRGLLSVRTSER